MDIDLSPQDKKDLDKFIKFFALKVRDCCESGQVSESVCRWKVCADALET